MIETFGYSKTFPILENKPEETSGDRGGGCISDAKTPPGVQGISPGQQQVCVHVC